MKRQHAPQALIQQVLAQLNNLNTTFEVWPQNHLAITLFLQLQTQWDRNPMDNSLQNIKWQSIETLMRYSPQVKALNSPESDQLFNDITTMERHALSEISKIKVEQNNG